MGARWRTYFLLFVRFWRGGGKNRGEKSGDFLYTKTSIRNTVWMLVNLIFEFPDDVSSIVLATTDFHT